MKIKPCLRFITFSNSNNFQSQNLCIVYLGASNSQNNAQLVLTLKKHYDIYDQNRNKNFKIYLNKHSQC